MSFDIPSSPADRQKFKLMLVEMTKALQRIDLERESLKEIANSAQEQFSIKKKLVSKLARTMYKHNYADLQAENEHFETLYETLVEGKKDEE
jgi:hypothetical protein